MPNQTEASYQTRFAGLNDETHADGIEAAREVAGYPVTLSSGEQTPRLTTLDTTPADIHTLADAVEAAERIEPRDLAFWDTNKDDGESEGWTHAPEHLALVNPDDEGGFSVYSTATDRYDAVNPDTIYNPLIDELRAHGHTDAFGEVRVYRDGGEVHMDVFLPQVTVEVPDETKLGVIGDSGVDETGTTDHLILGLTTGYDYYQNTTHYSRVIALNPATGAVMRDLTDRRSRRHIKPEDLTEGRTAEEVGMWWEGELERMDNVTSTLLDAIVEASDYVIDFSGIPFDAADFYSVLGTTGKLGEDALARLPSGRNGDIHTDGAYSAWELHKALAESLTLSFGSKTDGSAMRQYVKIANDILFRPPVADSMANKEFEFLLDEERLADFDTSDEDGTQQTLTGESAAARKKAILERIRGRQETAADRVGQYKTMKDRLKARLAQATETASEDSDADADSDSDREDDESPSPNGTLESVTDTDVTA